MAAKKAKKAKRKASTPPLTGSVKTIKYKCAGSCKATPKFAHMKPGDVVVLMAINTDVKIDFLGNSPFVSGTDPIRLAEGEARTEIVKSTAGHFEYTLTCSECPTSTTPPEMIVP